MPRLPPLRQQQRRRRSFAHLVAGGGSGQLAREMVYHSSFNDTDAQLACGCAMLPMKTATRGPAPIAPEGADDIIDEVLNFFKANVLFKHFEVKGPADKNLIYLIKQFQDRDYVSSLLHSDVPRRC